MARATRAEQVPTSGPRAVDRARALPLWAQVHTALYDELAEWRHTLVRGDRFTVSAQFSARDGYRLDGAGLDARK